jgi:hypothetical protein
MSEFLKLAHVIGTGLTNGNCQITLERISGQGQFWSYRGDCKSGIWCSDNDWRAGIAEIMSMEPSDELVQELEPLLIATLFSPVSVPFVKDIDVKGGSFTLISDIYPVVHCDGYRFALVGFTDNWLKSLTSGWQEHLGPPLLMKVPLVAGYVPSQTELDSERGVWLNLGQDPDKGRAVLWWDKPIADIIYQTDQEWKIEKVYPPFEFSDPVRIVQIATIELELNVLLNLEEGQHIRGSLECGSMAKLIESEQCLATGHIYVSDDGVIFFPIDG